MLLSDLAPLLLGVLLGWTGATKTFGRSTREAAGKTVLTRLLGTVPRATTLLRVVGVVELALASGLLLSPVSVWPALGTALLGCGFVGYLTYARVAAPTSSCGCTSSAAPIRFRTFARAGSVAAGGVLAMSAGTSWWSAFTSQPVQAILVVIVLGSWSVGLSTGLDHLWLLPLRRSRLWMFGHPLRGEDETVPLAATLDLLDRSAAWEQLAPVVRSGLLEHWDADGWRVLRYAGRSDDGPVSVLFALDVDASLATTAHPAVRVNVVPDSLPGSGSRAELSEDTAR